MMTDDINIRVAVLKDAEAVLDIYGYYVRKTAVTFEYEVPGLEEFRGRMEHTLRKYPFIVAECNGVILGYAYTGVFVGRAAYDWAAETTIYVQPDCKKMGIGKKLYQALEAISKAQKVLNLNACIGYPELEDDYLTKNSVQFHKHMGYEMVGEFHKCGYKFQTWYNMVWMEKMIGTHGLNPCPVLKFPDLSIAQLRSLGMK